VTDQVAFLKDGRMILAGAKDDLLDAWRLVKGGPELLDSPAAARAAGGRRCEGRVELLCPAEDARALATPEAVLSERPTLEDLAFFHGRPLETLPC